MRTRIASAFTDSYYNDETLRAGGKNLECGDLSPLLPLWRLVAKAGPRPAARESWTPSRIRRRQVACRKRGPVRALQSGCGFAALGNPCHPRLNCRFDIQPGLLGKRPEVGAAAAGQFPGRVQVAPAERGQFGV